MEKRSLPSWMGSEEGGPNSHRKKHIDHDNQQKAQGDKKIWEPTGHVKDQSNDTQSKEAAKTISKFSKLLEGVAFVLSGFVNPERSNLRSQALEMGAEYHPDWTSDCTLLICAFPNTPKFRQVEADCGTIVSKEWILECYNKKKLVEIDGYLMHAGNPWRKSSSHKAIQDRENILPGKTEKPVVRRPHTKVTAPPVSESGTSPEIAKAHLPPSKVKKWAIDDLAKTVLWLESQEEKPETDMVRKVAAEGIITCLQDAMEALEQNRDIRSVIEQWMFVPRVARELAELERGTGNGTLTKQELSKLANDCKRIYETEFDRAEDSSIRTKKFKSGEDEQKDDENPEIPTDDAAYDSDLTIEMTEEEIDQAYKGLTS